jgi:hypothetical protein
MVAVRCIGSVYRVVVTCFSETQAQTVADAMNQCAAKP